MKISIRNKILLAFSIFIGISGLIWLRSYYSQHILHQNIAFIKSMEAGKPDPYEAAHKFNKFCHDKDNEDNEGET